MHPYVEACAALRRAGVRYVIVGVFGINFYARDAGSVFTTADCDLLLPADAATLRKALVALRRRGFRFEAGGEPLPEADPVVLKGIVRARANVIARKGGERMDLALGIAGCGFNALWRKRRRFKAEGVTLNVGPLADLVASKEKAGRPKDRVFLETYRAALEELLKQENRR